MLLSRVRLHELDIPTRLIETKIYDQRALDTFLAGLNGNLGLAVSLQKPDTLEKAMSFVLEEENFNYARNRSTLSNSSNKLDKFKSPINHQNNFNRRIASV